MTPDLQIKVSIADDHKIFRDGIRMALKNKEYLKILWEAEDGKDLMHKMQIKKPDVLLMDIRMPEIDGINAIPLLRKEYEDVKIIVLTMYDDQEMISKMMEMGANAYLTKTTDPEEIYQAILACMNDDFYFNELVNNILKHSNASFIHVTQNINGDRFFLRLHHDGRGLTQADFEKLNKSPVGLGLKNIQSRLKLLSGNIYFEKDVSQTYYKVTIELSKEDIL